jgi:hypothetical protein
MPRHSRPRAKVTFSESAEKQIEALTDEAALLALDRAPAVQSVDPDAGAPIPAFPPGLPDHRALVSDGGPPPGTDSKHGVPDCSRSVASTWNRQP